MKNYGAFVNYPIVVISFLMFLITACQKDNGIVDDSQNGGNNEEEEEIYEKKGACISMAGMNWSKEVAKIKPFWHYSWGKDLNINQPENVEFIPMFWGKSVSDEEVAELKQLAVEGKIKYLLGFNEPDGIEQANMTVDEAIALWPKLEEVGVPLGSPAAVQPTGEWMKEFMTKATAQNLRIDFVCVHSYGGLNFSALKDKLNETYQEYGKPIWLTEFAVADWNAASVESNKYSAYQVRDFMKEALPALDKMDIVERYAWFSGAVTDKALAPSALYDENGNLTQLGMYYANHTPNQDAGPGKDAPIYPNIEGNLIPNGNFGDYHVYGEPDVNAPNSVGWFGYQITVEPVDAIEGWAGKMKNDWSGNAAFNNTFPVEAGKTYAISFYVKWLGKEGSIKMTLKDHDAIIAWEAAGKPAETKPQIVASSPAIIADAEGNNVWQQVSFEYTVPEGTKNMRLTLWKPEGSAICLIDEVLAIEK
ncbi:hypothetical protein E9993_08440 [Labilibacter sediminis]|nr:hypothetical protein E9993_08440 [Labilibacter sediminis]